MSSPEGAPPTSVAVAILARSGTDLPSTIEAVRRQVYGPQRMIVVGGESDARRIAAEHDVGWIANIGGAVDASVDASHLWIVREGVEPRPDALGSLVHAATRLDASVAGSKVLDLDDPDRLLSVGFATDVFDSPYTGFDGDERDQGQYDVVRDVAAVGRTVGLAPTRSGSRASADPTARWRRSLQPSTSASVRACAALAIIVVPSSEVLARDDSGKHRPVAGAGWSPPGDDQGLRTDHAAVGTPDGVLVRIRFSRSFRCSSGEWRFFDWLRAWAWYLPEAPEHPRRAERRAAWPGRRRRRAVPLPGQRLRRAQDPSSPSSRIGSDERLPGEDRLSVEAIGSEIRRPSFVVGAVAFLFVLLATRSIWTVGLPAVGYSLPFVESGAVGSRGLCRRMESGRTRVG